MTNIELKRKYWTDNEGIWYRIAKYEYRGLKNIGQSAGRDGG
jgi:hypothetical protein